ncbi:MAG: hypothetical protein FHP94_03140 [Denitromonas halophila]|nr:MAG: hypothetical protein FHP94_03140 [Denitromonas halophila]TVT72851.1 MAG: hypothetical protein FHP93_07640 [Denitromonas halophila]
MQIRIRRHTVTLVRTVYDPAIKRGRSVSLGTFSLDIESVPAEIDARLRPDEREQIEAILKRRQAAREFELEEIAARALPANLRRAVRWYERQKKTPDMAALARNSRDEFSQLLAAMVRAGVGRTRKRRPSPTL